MDKVKSAQQYKEQMTPRGSMKIEVVMEPPKKPKKDRPASASSIRNIEDIEKRQKVQFLGNFNIWCISIYDNIILQ